MIFHVLKTLCFSFKALRSFEALTAIKLIQQTAANLNFIDTPYMYMDKLGYDALWNLIGSPLTEYWQPRIGCKTKLLHSVQLLLLTTILTTRLMVE